MLALYNYNTYNFIIIFMIYMYLSLIKMRTRLLHEATSNYSIYR